MNLKKLNPWNWFKHENNERVQVPVTRKDAESVYSSDLALNNALPSANNHPLIHFHREIDRLFDDVWNTFGQPSVRTVFPTHATLPERTLNASRLKDFIPSLDVSGDEKQYEISIDLPGFSESDLSIELDGDTLTIKGSNEQKSETEDKQFYRVERSYGAFTRTLSLPEDSNTNDMKAILRHGVLKLEIPRLETSSKDIKRVPISS